MAPLPLMLRVWRLIDVVRRHVASGRLSILQAQEQRHRPLNLPDYQQTVLLPL